VQGIGSAARRLAMNALGLAFVAAALGRGQLLCVLMGPAAGGALVGRDVRVASSLNASM